MPYSVWAGRARECSNIYIDVYGRALMPSLWHKKNDENDAPDEGARGRTFIPGENAREREGIGNELPKWAADGHERDDSRRKKSKAKGKDQGPGRLLC